MTDRWGSGSNGCGGGGNWRSNGAAAGGGGGGSWNGCGGGHCDRPAVGPPPAAAQPAADNGCRWANSALRRPQRLVAADDGGGWQPNLYASAQGNGVAAAGGGAYPAKSGGGYPGGGGSPSAPDQGYGQRSKPYAAPQRSQDDEARWGNGFGQQHRPGNSHSQRWSEQEEEDAAPANGYGQRSKPDRAARWSEDGEAGWGGHGGNRDSYAKGGKPRNGMNGKASSHGGDEVDSYGQDGYGQRSRPGKASRRGEEVEADRGGHGKGGKARNDMNGRASSWKQESEEVDRGGKGKAGKQSNNAGRAPRWKDEEEDASAEYHQNGRPNDTLRQGGKGDKRNSKGKGRDRDRWEEEPVAKAPEKAAAKGKENGKSGQRSRKGDSGGKSTGKASAGQNHDSADPEPEVLVSRKKESKSGGTGCVSASHLAEKRFADLQISAATKRAIAEGFGYENMTLVQAATIEPMLAGKDVLARARTGTGKTLAFLVPIVERISSSTDRGSGIGAVVLSPTRELACQIADEAKVLLSTHRSLSCACFYGGTKINGDHNELKRSSCDILVATPGRMQDHLDNTPGFKARLQELMFVCLDEADQLLDMGFRDFIVKILKALPSPEYRQGALFSATFPDAVGTIAKLALAPSHEMIDTVQPDEEVTPDQIEQCVATTDLEGLMETLWFAVSHERAQAKQNHKIMCFFTTARLTQFYAEAFIRAGVEVLEMHSRKSQAHRTKCAERFRSAQKGIIFASDVLARGMDFPDVTAVIQVGIPSSRDQYIHRLGRTGRAGKSGRCSLLLCDFEAFFLKSVKDLPLQKLSATSAFPKASQAPDSLWEPPDRKTGGQAYSAWLGYYNSTKGLGWTKDRLVQEANRFAVAIGAAGHDGSPPPILKKTVGLMGLKGVPGLNIVAQLPYND